MSCATRTRNEVGVFCRGGHENAAVQYLDDDDHAWRQNWKGNEEGEKRKQGTIDLLCSSTLTEVSII